MILFREIELEMITLYQLVPRKMEAAIEKRVRNFLIPPPLVYKLKRNLYRFLFSL